MKTKAVSPIKMMVRCLAECKDGQWQAFSLEFGLAAQADSFAEAKSKLDGMIQDYLYDAYVGEDREHARELLTRKAPYQVFVRYYFAAFVAGAAKIVRRSSSGKRKKIFDEPWSFAPQRCGI
ncbi:MAG TPA: hypothetical protein VN692_09240 [Steroidobacteraceae bacterium]|nr:hypothetical protein [Steroidobacteraceae bacterium]